jgi:hypothetical protein
VKKKIKQNCELQEKRLWMSKYILLRFYNGFDMIYLKKTLVDLDTNVITKDLSTGFAVSHRSANKTSACKRRKTRVLIPQENGVVLAQQLS